MEVINALGRRKTAVARVYLTKGKGKISINKREMSEFFPIDFLQAKVHQPFALTGTAGQYDVKVNVVGGGINGQAEAVRPKAPQGSTATRIRRNQTRTIRV